MLKKWLINLSRDFRLAKESCKRAGVLGMVATHENIDFVHNMIIHDKQVTVNFIRMYSLQLFTKY
jgi:hypothetical protein